MLEVRDLTVAYSRVIAVRNVSFEVAQGKIVGLIGANGAGKSSILEAISGMKRPVEGTILLRGKPIQNLSSYRLMAKGIAHVPEGRLIFTQLTVGENLIVATPDKLSRSQAAGRRAEVLKWLPELTERLDHQASALSGGQQQLLAVGRGLMSEPALLLLDEPTMGLSPVATARMFSLMKALAQSGLTIIMVDQNISRVLALADKIHVVDNGQITVTDRPENLRDDARITEAFLGGPGRQTTIKGEFS